MTFPRLRDADLTKKVSDKETYQTKLEALQLDLLRLQQRDFRQGRRAIIVLEGWDASGKGGAIRRLTEKIDPRGIHVWPIGPPTAEEQQHHYLYRFWQKI